VFENATPESVGVSSCAVLELIKTFDKYRLVTHSIIMARGNKIFARCNYKPFDDVFQHRMYSVSKSFVSVAVGLAMTEGLLRLDDKITDYFPEYLNSGTDELYEETTIRDMLCMQSNVAGFVPWWGKYADRIESYYENPSSKIPGTLYYYDSVGSYLLGCIVEKLTGTTFLDYLKDKVLLQMGFSKESHTLYAPGGYTIGDSGVICTAQDLLIFARFVMDKGSYNGKQYIDKAFMEQAVAKQSDNNIKNITASWDTHGYGYLIWKTPDDGFAFIGMGDQLAICDVKRDFIFVITSDNQGDETVSRNLIFRELYDRFIPAISEKSLPCNEDAYRNLCTYLESCSLVCQQGKVCSAISEKINGITYVLGHNKMGIDAFKLSFDKNCGVFEFQKDGKIRTLEFGIGKNVGGEFPDDKRNLETAGDTGFGTYMCQTSAAWTTENNFVIKCQITDTYFGCLNIHLSFKDTRVTVLFKKSGQYILEGYEGYATGKRQYT